MDNMWKKQKTPRKKKKHGKSIIQVKDGRCYLCMKLGMYGKYPIVHKHHVFGGTANRKISEEYGLTVYLCPGHHEFSTEAVHANAGNMLLIRQDAQRIFEKMHSHEEFMSLFGKNYL